MHMKSARRLALLLSLLAGCSTPAKRPDPNSPPVGRGTQAAPKPLAIPDRPMPQARQVDDSDDRALLIPPPPKLENLTPAQPVVVRVPQPEETVADIRLVKGGSNALTFPSTQVEPPPAKMADDPLATIKRIHQRAVSAYGNPDMNSFVARLTRREAINGKMNPEEVISFMFRKQPYSVRLKWLGTEGQGREVIFVQGQYDNKMQLMPAKSDLFLISPSRMAFAPDDPMVRSKARHDIREAGFGESIKHFGVLLKAIDANPALRSRLRYLGAKQRAEFASLLDCVEETIPPQTEKLLPQGGKRFTFFDTAANAKSFGLPVLVVTYDAANKEVEYYRFDNFMYPFNLRDVDFDPDLIWKKK